MRENIAHDIHQTSEFEVDWTDHLDEGDKIRTSKWGLDDPGEGKNKIELVSEHDDNSASVTVTGGIANCQHLLTNRITTWKRKTHTAEYWLNTFMVPKDPVEDPKPAPAIKPKKKAKK